MSDQAITNPAVTVTRANSVSRHDGCYNLLRPTQKSAMFRFQLAEDNPIGSTYLSCGDVSIERADAMDADTAYTAAESLLAIHKTYVFSSSVGDLEKLVEYLGREEIVERDDYLAAKAEEKSVSEQISKLAKRLERARRTIERHEAKAVHS